MPEKEKSSSNKNLFLMKQLLSGKTYVHLGPLVPLILESLISMIFSLQVSFSFQDGCYKWYPLYFTLRFCFRMNVLNGIPYISLSYFVSVWRFWMTSLVISLLRLNPNYSKVSHWGSINTHLPLMPKFTISKTINHHWRSINTQLPLCPNPPFLKASPLGKYQYPVIVHGPSDLGGSFGRRVPPCFFAS